MATNNISKIVRGNLNFKPWISAKNPTEIVNSYVQKLYKEIPDNFKNDLMKPRNSVPKSENRLPIRAAKLVAEKFSIPIITNKPTSKLRSNGYRSPAITTKNSFVTAPKKFLKTPNFKIYTKRRYASSISSSKSSFVRNKSSLNEEYRRKIYKPAQGVQFQTFRANGALPSTTFYENSVTAKNIPPTRLFNEFSSHTKAAEVSKVICNDLMSVNDELKRKLRPAKLKPLMEPLEMPKKDFLELSFKGWNHPSLDHYNKLTHIPVVQKPEKTTKESLKSGLSSFGLMPVKRKPFGGKFAYSVASPRKEKVKRQSLLSSFAYGGISTKEKSFQIDLEPRKEKNSQCKCYNSRDPLDFVCMSRAERSNRIRSQRI